MHEFFLACGLVLCAATILARAEETPLNWALDLDEAISLAGRQHKDLLVNFTGVEWCGHCMKQADEFREELEELRERRQIDFPNRCVYAAR